MSLRVHHNKKQFTSAHSQQNRTGGTGPRDRVISRGSSSSIARVRLDPRHRGVATSSGHHMTETARRHKDPTRKEQVRVHVFRCTYAVGIDERGLTRAHVRVNNSPGLGLSRGPAVTRIGALPSIGGITRTRGGRRQASQPARQLNGRFVTERQTGTDCTGFVT